MKQLQNRFFHSFCFLWREHLHLYNFWLFKNNKNKTNIKDDLSFFLLQNVPFWVLNFLEMLDPDPRPYIKNTDPHLWFQDLNLNRCERQYVYEPENYEFALWIINQLVQIFSSSYISTAIMCGPLVYDVIYNSAHIGLFFLSVYFNKQ